MHSQITRGLALLVLVTIAPLVASADAVSDQKRVLEAHGFTIPHPPAMCNLLTAGEAARALGKSVKPGESAGSISGCAYRAADGSNDGVLVSRGDRSNWYPPTTNDKYRVVGGLGEKAYVANEMGIGYEAVVMSAKGITNVLMSGSKTPAGALALVRIAMNR